MNDKNNKYKINTRTTHSGNDKKKIKMATGRYISLICVGNLKCFTLIAPQNNSEHNALWQFSMLMTVLYL